MVDPRFYELINHLWRGGKYAYFWTPDDGMGQKVSYWLTLPTSDKVPKLFLDKDAYFGVNPSVIRRSEHERARIHGSFDIAALNCFYTEFDGDHAAEEAKAFIEKLAQLGIKPACVVFSGGGYHIYIWLTVSFVLDSPEKQKRAVDLQWSFAKFAGGDADVCDITRVLRIPGTTNHKAKYAPNFPLVTIVEWEPSNQYEIADLEPFLQPIIEARDSVKAHTPTPTMGAVSLNDAQLLDVLFKSKNGVVYQELWAGNLSAANGDHSKADQMLANGLAWLTGRDIYRMDSLFRQSGLMRDKWADRQQYRENTLNNAASSAQTVYDPSHNGAIDPAAVAAAQAAVGMNGGNGGSQPPPKQPGGGNAAPQPQQPSGGNSHKAPNNPASADYIKSLQNLGYYFRLNDLDDLVEVNQKPLNDVIAAQIRSQMRDLGYLGRHIGAMEDAYLAHAGNNRYHPVKDYLQGSQWNGDDHIRLLSMYFKDKHNSIIYNDGSHETVFYVWLKRWLVGAVAKVCEAGTLKAQNSVLVIEGNQNLGKSTFASWLCSGMPHHFIEQAVDPENKEHIRSLAGKWIWEIGEMGSTTRKADRESLKNFLTQTTVTFRTPYAKHPVIKPALASFIGTVNNEGGFLQDSTGTRRFMTVGLVKMDHAYMQDIDVDQIWAQAYHLYRTGESWRLLPEEVQSRDELNGDYKVEDPYEGWIKRYFEVDLARADAKTVGWFTTTQEIVNELKKQGVTGDTRAITMYLASTMKELGLEKDRHPKPSGPRGYWGVKIRP